MAQPFVIEVDNPDDVLIGYGPGALARVERDTVAAMTSAIEIGVVPIIAGQTDYPYWDPTGTTASLYRTRYSIANPTGAASDYSEYSPVFRPSTSLLTVDAFREHVTTTRSDDALQRLLDANTLAITQRAGPVGTATLTLTPSRDRYVFLDRPVSAITSITEYFNDPVGISGVVLDATDYRLLSAGTLLERWGYGTHPADWWSDRVELVYVPVDDTAERVRVLIKLCELDLNRKPGLSAISIGDYSEQSRNEAYNDEREAILASLVPSALTFA